MSLWFSYCDDTLLQLSVTVTIPNCGHHVSLVAWHHATVTIPNCGHQPSSVITGKKVITPDFQRDAVITLSVNRQLWMSVEELISRGTALENKDLEAAIKALTKVLRD